jgi:hypothetical protein
MKLTDLPANQATKLLYIGDSGAGKTGSLASLAKAGYNLYILDLDKGTDVLLDLLKSDPEAMARIDVEQCSDEYGNQAGKLVPTKVTGFTRAIQMLDNWPGKGKLNTWTPKDVLVVDSFTLLGKMALNYVLQMNGRVAGPPQLQDWGAAMSMQENVIAMLYSSSITCNVIVTAHVKYLQDDGDAVKVGYPEALGKKLSPTIGRYFNGVIQAQTQGTGANAKQKILTKSKGLIELKTPAPNSVKPEYELASGLAEYFAAVVPGALSASRS